MKGTYLFDGQRASRNFALDKMCMSPTSPESRAAFVADETAYCQSFGLGPETIRLVKERDWIGMVQSGGNIYYVFKISAIDRISMQHVGAQQNAMTLADFRAKLNAHKETEHG